MIAVVECGVKTRGDLFYLHEQQMTLDNAASFCKQLGGMIADNFGSNDADLLNAIRSSTGQGNASYWTGAVNFPYDLNRYFWLRKRQEVTWQLMARDEPQA